MKVMIASNTPVETNRRVLQSNNIDPDIIDDFVGPSPDMPRKPAPDMFLKSLKTSGFDKSAAVIFEDTYIGVQAGLSAGIDTCYLISDHNKHIKLPEKTLNISRAELMALYK